MMPTLPGQSVQFSAAQLPVAIDYPAALSLRQMAQVHDELPKYLLAPEAGALLIISVICTMLSTLKLSIIFSSLY